MVPPSMSFASGMTLQQVHVADSPLCDSPAAGDSTPNSKEVRDVRTNITMAWREHERDAEQLTPAIRRFLAENPALPTPFLVLAPSLIASFV